MNIFGCIERNDLELLKKNLQVKINHEESRFGNDKVELLGIIQVTEKEIEDFINYEVHYNALRNGLLVKEYTFIKSTEISELIWVEQILKQQNRLRG